jgi:hypothetical protein
VGKYLSQRELEDKADWEGGPAEFVFVAAVTRLATQAADDLDTFGTWLRAPEGGANP